MKLKQAIEELGANDSIRVAEKVAEELDVDWNNSAKYVFNVIANDLSRVVGNIGGKNDDNINVITKWLKKYQKGYNERASQRISNPPGTISDPAIEQIIGTRLPHLKEKDLNEIVFAHRLGMSAENILGLILEEYLSENLRDSGWHCAWGETVKSVDFVNEDGALLQIKNRSNSENSASSSVRDGTEIQKWYRIRADRIEYMWEKLNDICKTSHLSEDSFIGFVKTLLENNPGCFAVEDDNPWEE